MKVLVNGGLNLSSLDGWWAEAYGPDVGWALGDVGEGGGPAADEADSRSLYEIIERQVVPEFYDRDSSGVPRAWVARMRASLSRLTPRFSSNRMVREYVERMYLPASARSRHRLADGLTEARGLVAWQEALREAWPHLRFGNVRVEGREGRWEFRVEAYLDRLDPSAVSVEVWADPAEEGRPGVRVPLDRVRSLAGTTGGFVFAGSVPAERPAEHYTPRIVPRHPGASLPLEEAHILWQR
jgi:starch phosphorylase